MANEATITCGLTIRKVDSSGNGLEYRSSRNSFRDDVSGQLGPVPGALYVGQGGVKVDLSELVQPGWCRITHIGGDGEMLEWGVYDADSDTVVIVGELSVGNVAQFKLSRYFGEEYAGTGTGTTEGNNQVFLRSLGSDTCNALVEVFEA